MSLSDVTRSFLVDMATRPAHAYQSWTYLGDASIRGRTIPFVDADAAAADITARAAPTDEAPSSESLLVDQSVAVNVGLPMQESQQYLEGAWAQQAAQQFYQRLVYRVALRGAAEMMRAATDGGLAAAPFDGANVVNGALGTLQRTDFGDAEAGLVGGGAPRSSMAYYASPRAFGRVRELFGSSIREMDVLSPALGVGYASGLSLNGVPLIEAQELTDTYSVAATASTIATNVCTATVPVGHGLQVGTSIWTSGGTANVASSSPTPITAATATSVSFALTASDGANGAMSITVPASPIVLGLPARMFWAGDLLPRVREVADVEKPMANAIQMAMLFGLRALNGATRVIWVP
jgi:hypothetical protein